MFQLSHSAKFQLSHQSPPLSLQCLPARPRGNPQDSRGALPRIRKCPHCCWPRASKGKGSKGNCSKGKGSEGKGSKGSGSKDKGSRGNVSKGKGSDGNSSKGEGSNGKAR